MTDEQEGINFWPAFSDAMLAVILVLLLVLGAVYMVIGERVKVAEDCQKQFAAGLPDSKKLSGRSVIAWDVVDKQSKKVLLSLEQDVHDKLLLHITFSDSVLFDDCDDKLGDEGRVVLTQVGQQIKKQIGSIVEIEILGHADLRPPTFSATCPFSDNLHLASARADAVFLFLEHEANISPIEHAMSATSYGEFFPSSRELGRPYTEKDLADANATEQLMQKNRRVELVLRYGMKMQGCEVKN